MAQRRESPTLPLPPPRSISLDQFVEVATGAALRALQAQKSVGPQPDPWHIWIGIIASQERPQLAAGARKAPRVAGDVAAQVGRPVTK
jgi:hypothetical protein